MTAPILNHFFTRGKVLMIRPTTARPRKSLKPIGLMHGIVCYYSKKLIDEGCIYVHYPYCLQKCSYCSFVKFVPQPGKFWTFSEDIIQDGMIRELQNILKSSTIRSVVSVFFGGGTPSLAQPSLIESILKVINQYSSLSESAEVTLEANPTHLNKEKLKSFQNAGVNRLSIGVQSLNHKNLKILNRDHSVDEAVQCITLAKDIFPRKVSVDMMFALPFQTCDLWREDLESVLRLCDNHLSLYQLTLERGTKLYKDVKSGILTIPDDDGKAEMYEMAIDLLEHNDFHRYEISNFAKNFESESVHNKAVWQGMQFIGIGPGAHSRVFYMANSDGVQVNSFRNRRYIREARRNASDPSSWLSEINAKGNSLRLCERQSTLDFLMEYVATSLRTTEGLSHKRWWEICNVPLTDIIIPNDVNTEFIYFDNNGDLKATPKGLNVLDSVLPKLINIIEDKRTLFQ